MVSDFFFWSVICSDYMIYLRNSLLKNNGLFACFKSNFDSTYYVYRITMSRIVRKPDFCLCENKGADQLRGNREADQRLCFRYTDSTFPLLLISEISSF